jgi:dTDP-3-amino-3,4,6-trideoxy-alpha-D-glucose transaminase
VNIPFLDLTSQYEGLRPAIDSAIGRVLERGRFILGEEVAAFEREFADYCGAKQAVAVACGTEALQLALLACGVGPGDEVMTSAHTAVATVAAIEMAGARPVLVDIDPLSQTLDPARVAACLTPRTRAVVPVHLHGCPADLSPLLEIARTNQLFVVEDCAQAHGARYRGRHVGTWGHGGSFSFYPTKNLGAYGDGGAVVTEDAGLADRVRKLRQYGWGPDRVSERKGINSCLDELQAAILRVKLTHLDAWNSRRRELATSYRTVLGGSGVGLPPVPAECEPVYHHFVIRHEQRDALRLFLASGGIETMVHYSVPVHLQKAYVDLGYRTGDLPEAERASREVLSLPLYPEMTDEMVERISLAILDFPGR